MSNLQQGQPNSLSDTITRATLTELAAVIVGFLYVSGYFIDSMFAGNLGISHRELLRLEYIKIGFAFVLLTLGFAYLPVGTFFLSFSVRKTSGLPHFLLGAVGNSLNTVLFLGLPVFLALFATKSDWDMSLRPRVLSVDKFSTGVAVIGALTAVGTILVPFGERIVFRYTRGNQKLRGTMFNLVVEPIRYVILGIALYLTVGILRQIPWLWPLMKLGWQYFLAGVVLPGGIFAAVLWSRHIRPVQRSWLVYTLIGIGAVAIYFLAVASYVKGVYIFIPSNRGGRLPLTRAYFTIKEDEKLLSSRPKLVKALVSRPAYVVEESDSTYYVIIEKMERWLFDFPPVESIAKDQVPFVHYERIENGFPRTTSRSLTQPNRSSANPKSQQAEKAKSPARKQVVGAASSRSIRREPSTPRHPDTKP